MILNKKKKAFTLVEIVIVIAVIAILAAILIPTFSNVIENARISSDTAIVKNINSILQIEEVSSGKKESLQEALDDAYKGGYSLEKITPTSNGDIVWNEEINRFALIKDDKLLFGDDETKEILKKEKHKLWKIVNNVNDLNSSEYSLYLINAESDEITVNSGIDTSKSEIKKIIYTGSDITKSIKIYTNSADTTLEIDALKDTVKHYGLVKSVLIKNISSESYEEYGSVLSGVEINKGKFYAGNTSDIRGGVVCNPSSNLTKTITISASEDAIISSIILGDNYDSTNSPTSVENNLPKKFTIINNKIDDDTKESLVSIGKNKFDGGLGLIDDPFQIANFKQLCNLSDFENTQYFFKQTKDITVNSKDLFLNGIIFNGIYDGDGHKIILNDNLQESVGVTLFTAGKSCVVKNVDLYSTPSCLLSVIGFKTEDVLTERVNLYNINTYSTKDEKVLVNRSNTGPFINGSLFFTSTSKVDVDVEIEKCTNYIDIQNTGTCTGVFFGGCFYYGYDPNVVMNYKIKDCVNKGDIYSDGQAGLVFGNASGVSKAWGLKTYTLSELEQFIKIDNLVNYGVLSYISSGGSGIFAGSSELNAAYENSVINNGTYTKATNYLENKDIKIYYDEYGKLKIYGSDLDKKNKYKLEIILPNVEYSSNAAFDGRRFKIDLEQIDEVKTTDKIFITNKKIHNAVSYEDLYEDYQNGGKLYNINPDKITYDYLFEGYYYMGYYVNSNGILTIAIDKRDYGKTYPQFKTNKIATTSFIVYSYNDEGFITGYKVIKQ